MVCPGAQSGTFGFVRSLADEISGPLQERLRMDRNVVHSQARLNAALPVPLRSCVERKQDDLTR